MDQNRLEEESKLLLEHEVQPKRISRWLLVPIIVIGIGYGSYRWWHMARPAAAADSTNTSSAAGSRGRRGGAGRASVVTIPARKMDMPVYLRGLGTAAASNTVTVRSRVRHGTAATASAPSDLAARRLLPSHLGGSS